MLKNENIGEHPLIAWDFVGVGWGVRMFLFD